MPCSRLTTRLLLLASAALATTSVAAQTLPARKPGLWEMSIQEKGEQALRMRQCIDAATDAKLQAMGSGMAKQSCTKNTHTKVGNTWVGESVCQFGKSTITSKSVMTGDFDREVRVEVSTSYVPPMMGMSSGQSTIVQRHAGPCPAGWQPGDTEMPGSNQRMNINSMPAMGGKR